ncbi:MAG: hypothetical protein V1728_03850 [Candidatus Micrarchaeota archaeon]
MAKSKEKKVPVPNFDNTLEVCPNCGKILTAIDKTGSMKNLALTEWIPPSETVECHRCGYIGGSIKVAEKDLKKIRFKNRILHRTWLGVYTSARPLPRFLLYGGLAGALLIALLWAWAFANWLGNVFIPARPDYSVCYSALFWIAILTIAYLFLRKESR